MTIENNHGQIRLAFQHQGKRFRLDGLGAYDDRKRLAQVKGIEERIRADRQNGQFPFSTAEEVRLFYFPTVEDRTIIATKLLAEERSKQKASVPLLTIWDRWVASLNRPASTLNNKYHPVRQHIKSTKPQAEDGIWLLRMAQQKSWSAATWQAYKGLLKSCLDWAIENNLVQGKNPYTNLKYNPSQPKTDHVKPFTPEEFHRILEAFKSNQFSSKGSRFPHAHYAPYVEFMFLTGCRPGEAIALTWEDVDGANGSTRIDKAATSFPA